MKLALVGLPLAGRAGDPFGSIPAMPTALPSLSAAAKRLGAEVQVIDAFGARPSQLFRPCPGVVARGLTPAEIVSRIDGDVDLVGISVHSVAGDTVALDTIRQLRGKGDIPIVVGGAHPSVLPERFLEAGARWVLRGEGEPALARLLGGSEPSGLVEGGYVEDLDGLPLPDFSALPLDRYWRLGLGHGPVQGRHLDVTSSRGCSHGCRFCATPSLVRGRWRGMSASRVVDLMAGLRAAHGARDFHFEDDDFAADRDRVLAICDGLRRRALGVRFALPSGVRSESLDGEVLGALAGAGCHYLSLAPESGSRQLLRAMGKTIDPDRIAAVAAEAVRQGIRVGCFFILGYPGETPDDRRMTAELAERLVRLGVDDLSIFVWSPLPGAAAFDLERGYDRLEELCWSPRWRGSYWRFEGARTGIYLRALAAVARARPGALVASGARVLRGRYETKGEMTLSRMLRWRR